MFWKNCIKIIFGFLYGKFCKRLLKNKITIMALEITDANFEEIILNTDKPVMIDFWAVWCGPCRMIAPVLEEISKEQADKVNVAKCDVDANPTLSHKFGIRNIPAVLFFKDGKLIDRQIGAASKSSYLTKINSLQ